MLLDEALKASQDNNRAKGFYSMKASRKNVVVMIRAVRRAGMRRIVPPPEISVFIDGKEYKMRSFSAMKDQLVFNLRIPKNDDSWIPV